MDPCLNNIATDSTQRYIANCYRSRNFITVITEIIFDKFLADNGHITDSGDRINFLKM